MPTRTNISAYYIGTGLLNAVAEAHDTTIRIGSTQNNLRDVSNGHGTFSPVHPSTATHRRVVSGETAPGSANSHSAWVTEQMHATVTHLNREIERTSNPLHRLPINDRYRADSVLEKCIAGSPSPFYPGDATIPEVDFSNFSPEQTAYLTAGLTFIAPRLHAALLLEQPLAEPITETTLYTARLPFPETHGTRPFADTIHNICMKIDEHSITGRELLRRYESTIPAIGQTEDPLTLCVLADEPDRMFVVMLDGETQSYKGHRLYDADMLKSCLTKTNSDKSPLTRQHFDVTSVCSLLDENGAYVDLKLF